MKQTREERRQVMRRWYANRSEAQKAKQRVADKERQRIMRANATPEKKAAIHRYGTTWRKKNPYSTWPKESLDRRRISEKERAKKKRKELKDRVYEHYGRFCSCCGERNQKFLTVDHVNDDGAKHRKEVPATDIHKEIIRLGFPDSFRIQCYNCNCGRAKNGGICPHEEERLANTAMLQLQ